MMMEFLTALTLGFLGSAHCIGMCGPLVLALPSERRGWTHDLAGRFLHQAGKALTYAVLGIVVGLVGKGLFMGVQQRLSVIMGVTLLLTVAAPYGLRAAAERYSPLRWLHQFTRERFGRLMQRRGKSTLFLLGVLNGLLPCGLVYTALVAAAVVADPVRSAVFMMIFGFGTAPALIAVSLSGRLLTVRYRTLLNRVLPVFSIALAVLLILRGLNLGIPMVSPKIVVSPPPTVQQAPAKMKTAEPTMDCCKE